MQFIGLTRFSVVTKHGLGSFRATRQLSDREEVLRVVLSEDRLRHRFALFETFTLPSIRLLMAQEPAYHHLIAVSDHLPSPYTERLRALTSHLSRVRLLTTGWRDDVRAVFKSAVTGMADGDPVYTFRLDDDDALASNYFDLVRAALGRDDRDVAVSIDDGFALVTAGARYRLKPQHRPRIALGLGLASCGPTIFDLGNHTKIDGRIEVRHVRDRPGWVRVKHAYSDVRRRWWKAKDWWWPSCDHAGIHKRLGPAFAHIRLVPRHGDFDSLDGSLG